MQYDIITCGIPMVELMRKKLDQPLYSTGEFAGPFPAGDPGVLLNAAVKLGCRGGYVGVVGDDDFGKCFLDCMIRNRVDVSHIRIDPHHMTGLSMVAKFEDGSRKFIFALSQSAAAQLGPQDFDTDLLQQVRWIHVSGFALSVSESIAQLHKQIMAHITDDVMVSFDPNYRKEIIAPEAYLKRCLPVFKRCNLFLPSSGEASLFCPQAVDEQNACRMIAGQGKTVVWKDGGRGARGYQNGKEYIQASFPIEEIDPTGAGDIFGGAVVTSLLRGETLERALRYGCAAGALAVNRVGLMDIAPAWEELETLLASGRVTGGQDELLSGD